MRKTMYLEGKGHCNWVTAFLLLLCLVVSASKCSAGWWPMKGEKLAAAEDAVQFMIPEKEFYDGVERGARLALKDVSMSETEKDAMVIITVAHVRDNGTLIKMRRDLADFLADKFSLEEIKQLKELYTTPLMKRIQSEVAPKVVELSVKYAK